MKPGKIVCVGRNYADHAAELGSAVPSEPLIFLKPPSALIAGGEAVRVPPDAGRVDYEGEIGLVVGRRCRRVPERSAWDYVSGVAAVNDVTARTLQRSDSQWTRAKGLDTFCPLGNVVGADSVDRGNIAVTTRVNGELRQHGTTADMVFSIPRLVSYISHVMTLEPGDLIATGTPEGVGPLVPGDVVEVALSCGSEVRSPVVAGASLAPDTAHEGPD
jgi:2-keto-4-pentenoate hydratase/2-oxohepta-3-ene-1,7-dioic acid hydratase in catechol pathway